jgi:hypothetical protein
LYDSNETQIAESFILATRLPASGTYYAKVEDLWSIFGDPTTVGGPDASYVFDIVELLDGVDDYYFDMELGDDAASAVTIPASGGLFFPSMVGLYDHAADRDVFSFTLDGTGTQYFDAYVSAPGPNGNGSTSDFNELWITDATGSEILARIDSDQFSLTPPLPSPASYLLWVEKGATAPAANDFYEVSCFGGVDDNPEELEPPATTGANDTIALADAAGEDVELTADGAFFITYLPAGDVDYIGFDASSGLAIEAFCVAADFGSGLLGMTGEIRDSSDTTLSSATEPSAVVLDTTLPGAGRYYFRLSAAGQDPEVTGNWVRCRLRVPSF